jgi:hypothetical protein
MSAARKIARLAVGSPAIRTDVETFFINPLLRQNQRTSDDLPLGTRGGTAIRYRFPLDGTYLIEVRMRKTRNTNYVDGIADQQLVEIRLDGVRVKQFTIGGEHVGPSEGIRADEEGPPDLKQAEYARSADEHLRVRIPVQAGTRLVQVSFLEEFSTADLLASGSEPGGDQGGGSKANVSTISITGPLDVNGPGETASRARLFVCSPKNKNDEETCAKQILTKLARRAYRRPVTDADVQPLMGLFKAGQSAGNFDLGIERAVQGVLVSPLFLFRIERDPDNVPPNTRYFLRSIELASRLSFFLWSSIPDDELLDLAERDQLRDPVVLDQQVRRMLADSRSKALVDNFAGQWLLLRNLRTVTPSETIFREFDENLREAFQKETELFIESMLEEDRPITDVLNADYTFVNERLARHYGIPGIYGTRFRRVTLTDENRRGLLGQGSILTVTAIANRTSPVVRGKWVLENLLGAPPPPPPPVVPSLMERSDSGKQLSMRQQMEIHRSNPACASCHAQMDPIGFALENFDGIGKWRTIDAGVPIDASGVLPDGSKFQGPTELRKTFLSRPEQLVNTVTSRLLMYALGRGLESYDAPIVRKILRDAAQGGYRWSSIISGIVKSTPFQMRMSGESHGQF